MFCDGSPLAGIKITTTGSISIFDKIYSIRRPIVRLVVKVILSLCQMTCIIVAVTQSYFGAIGQREIQSSQLRQFARSDEASILILSRGPYKQGLRQLRSKHPYGVYPNFSGSTRNATLSSVGWRLIAKTGFAIMDSQRYSSLFTGLTRTSLTPWFRGCNLDL